MTPAGKRRALLAAGAAGTAAIAAGLGWRQWVTSSAPDEAARTLFTLTLPSASGSPFPLASLAGRSLVLNFWATWCVPCIDEMPDLSALHQEFSGRNTTIVGIGIDSADKIRQFSEKHRLSYPLLVGGPQGMALGRQFGNASDALPFTAVINAVGRITYRKLGRVSIRRLRSEMTDALSGIRT